ncbi:MAG: hypothetical protein AAGB05_05715 [Pseudomonadota bacterium]
MNWGQIAQDRLTAIAACSEPGAGPAVLLGSHQDSAGNAGRYDGIMGIALACLSLEKLRADGVALPYPVEVLAFADEEGVRFPTALLGPRALAGTADPEILDRADADGIRLRDALQAFGCGPDSRADDRPAPIGHPVLSRGAHRTRARPRNARRPDWRRHRHLRD